MPWTAHVHEYDQLTFSKDEAENEEMMPAVYFWTKEYANRDEETWAFETDGEFRIDEYGVGYRLLIASPISFSSSRSCLSSSGSGGGSRASGNRVHSRYGWADGLPARSAIL